jgi:hypothetical protein
MAKRSATASVINKNMEPKDVEALESQFRRWVKSAAQLGMVQILQDSNALAGEVVRYALFLVITFPCKFGTDDFKCRCAPSISGSLLIPRFPH